MTMNYVMTIHTYAFAPIKNIHAIHQPTTKMTLFLKESGLHMVNMLENHNHTVENIKRVSSIQ